MSALTCNDQYYLTKRKWMIFSTISAVCSYLYKWDWKIQAQQTVSTWHFPNKSIHYFWSTHKNSCYTESSCLVPCHSWFDFHWNQSLDVLLVRNSHCRSIIGIMLPPNQGLWRVLDGLSNLQTNSAKCPGWGGFCLRTRRNLWVCMPASKQ